MSEQSQNETNFKQEILYKKPQIRFSTSLPQKLLVASNRKSILKTFQKCTKNNEKLKKM